MKANYVDCDGAQVRVGDTVQVLKIPDWLVAGLPVEDKEAIDKLVGVPVRIAAFDAHGNAELEFEEPPTAPRTIWIEPGCLKKS